MNFRSVFYVLGWILRIEAALLLLPAAIGGLYHEWQAAMYLVVSAVCLLLGVLLSLKKPKHIRFFAKEGYMITALSWIVMSLFGCLPFMLTGEIPSFVDAYFEMVSGFTTTGASIVPNVELLSRSTNLWRCFSHWIGGMGVLVFLLAVLPMVGGSNMHLMRAESPGPSVGKLVPKMRYTAQTLYLLYFLLTIAEFVLLMLARMHPYEALCAAFGTAGTGGFGVRADSMASYSPVIQWIVTCFMLLFGVNFNVYFLLYVRRFRDALRCEEMRAYFAIVAAATLLICLNTYNRAITLEGNVREAAFQVASIITTTGYATADFDRWPELSRLLLVLIMFVGACAGSTGGGLKVSRFVIAGKALRNNMRSFLHPREVRSIHFEGKRVEEGTIRAIFVYFFAVTMIFFASILLLSLDNKDLVTTVSAVSATFNNIGPGLGEAGPTSCYAGFSSLSKLVMIFDMLAGRLEVFPMLVLFYPPMWKGVFELSVTQRRSRAHDRQPVSGQG